MDKLELLKKQWQSREQEFPHLSYADIYKMMLKKSSSIVKWIFIISIAELTFWTVIVFLLPESYRVISEKMGIHDFVLYSNLLHYCIFAGFIYYFYKNYAAIRVTDNTKGLMKSIIKVQKTVRYFVYYNVGMFVVSSVIINVIYYKKSDQLYAVLDFAEKGVSKDNFADVFLFSEIIVGLLFLILLLLFYWLVYGSLLRKLKKNYKELKRIED